MAHARRRGHRPVLAAEAARLGDQAELTRSRREARALMPACRSRGAMGFVSRDRSWEERGAAGIGRTGGGHPVANNGTSPRRLGRAGSRVFVIVQVRHLTGDRSAKTLIGRLILQVHHILQLMG